MNRQKSSRNYGLWPTPPSAGERDGFYLTPQPSFQVVDGTLDAPAPTVQNVGVDHGRFNVLMPEQFLTVRMS